MISTDPSFRASPQFTEAVDLLGPLVEFVGKWVGKGVNIALLPAKGKDPPFFRLINATIESLEFMTLGARVPNRGFVDDTIFLSGLRYLQQITDANTLEAIHVEAGQWLHVPDKTPSGGDASVVRQSTILHGDAFLAQGPVIPPSLNLGPTIDPATFMPTLVATGQPINDPRLSCGDFVTCITDGSICGIYLRS